MAPDRNSTQAKAAVACAVLAVLTALWLYWMVVPGLLFGIAAIVLGWRSRRDGGSELGSAALAVGIVAVLLVPSVLFIADEAEEWGRDCVVDPGPDC
ncbi:MAG TPA: hypothetical protein VFZ83_14875 [Acidimicrobiia bacterium]|nr:hypothetical protein [Acidimicrobiia bacterium]